jgi:hypothetical protein
VHDGVNVSPAQKTVQEIAVGDIADHQLHALRHSLSMTPAEVVEDHDLVPSPH